jgi:uncharacterized protein (TIGR03437 family)
LAGILLTASAWAQTLTLAPVVSGISNPTDVQSAGDGSGRLFLVGQDGTVRILRNGQLAATLFLDITSKTAAGGERGLLGLAFPPDFIHRQHFYIDYTDLNGNSVVSRWQVSASNPDVADPSSEQIVLTQLQPYPNHNGGQIQFGPDGFLYVGFGDGGSANDPQGNGQNRKTFLGKLLRIDVESGSPTYTVPPTNPFVNDSSYLPEIWALGLRNPWRFSFDRSTGNLWIGDVGQDRAEEVDYQPAGIPGGQNYGWNVMEGLQCRVAGCDPTPYVAPILEYTHDNGDCAITGGYVYRGTQSPGLRGTYLYADYCGGHIWGVRRDGDQWSNQLLLASGQKITTFGQDEQGELYVAAQDTGQLSRIVGPVAPVVSAKNVVNAASYQGALVAGSAATAFASGLRDQEGVSPASTLPLPGSIDGVSVTVAGHTAPLYAVANVHGQEQVNFQVPFEVAGMASAPLVITRNGTPSAAVTVQLAVASPGIFTGDGQTAVAVRGDNNTLITADNAATAGMAIYFYATGLGAVENAPASGAPASLTQLSKTISAATVTLGGKACEVPFAGLAPGFVGVYQVNITVPGGVPAGSAQLVVTMDTAASPAALLPVR